MASISRPPLILHGFTIVLLLGVVVAPAQVVEESSDTGVSAQERRLDGEHGLWIEERDDRIIVHWITAQQGSGSLSVRAGRRTLHRFTTSSDSSRSHTVSFPRPDRPTITLRYGSAGRAAAVHETTLNLDRPRGRESVESSGVASVYVLGDVHGQYSNLGRLLRNAGVVNRELRWSAGRSHLIVLGDLFSRGPDATRVLWFLYRLEREAERAGGRVRIVLGNHEIMVFSGDLRYVHPKEMEIASRHGTSYGSMYDPRTSLLGRWLASKPAAIRVNGVLMAHGGVSTDYLSYSLRSLDDTLASYLSEELLPRWTDPLYTPPMDSAALDRRTDFFFGDRSVFWYRDYVLTDSAGDALDRVLEHFGAHTHVIAHTRVPWIQERYGGRVLAVNTESDATELLHLVRQGRELHRYRYTLTGGPLPLSTPGGTPPEPEGGRP